MDVTVEQPALEARGVSSRVETRLLVGDVDLAVESGELVALVGPNGAGKSTLLSLLAGDRRPSTGTVLVGGRPIDELSALELARARAVLPQHAGLRFPFPVRDVVAMGRYPHLPRWRPPGTEDHAIVERSMRETDVDALAARSFTTLSGGEQTRVALARVLAQEARVLLLDEPTTALDLRHQHGVLRICRRLAESGRAVLVVVHDLTLASAWADRIGVLRAGRLVASGRPRSILTPELVAEVFEHPVSVIEHPTEDWPVVIPTTGRRDQTGQRSQEACAR